VLLFSMMLIVGILHLVGFFEWNAEIVLRRLKPSRLLPAVVFTSGVLSAFFVNDIVCLVMVPLVLGITRRLRLEPLPYLLAVATASNIGSVASITGNPQNMLIGSFSGIAYRAFLLHLGPVAVVGLFLDWLVLHWIHMRKVKHAGEVNDGIPLPPLDLSRLTKPVIVVTAVVIAFFAGVPPAMAAALGAAVLLITRVGCGDGKMAPPPFTVQSGWRARRFQGARQSVRVAYMRRQVGIVSKQRNYILPTHSGPRYTASSVSSMPSEENLSARWNLMAREASFAAQISNVTTKEGVSGGLVSTLLMG
jgi:hypothetical protein